MGPWLKGHSTTMPYNDLQTYLANENGSWKQYINLAGYQWFAYSFMPYLISTDMENIENSENSETSDKIYPNPAAEFVTLKNKNNESGELRLYDLSSRIVLNEKYNGTTTINIGQLAQGTYF